MSLTAPAWARAAHLLDQPVVPWYCPNGCDQTAITRGLVPNRFHECPRLFGLVAPLVRVGVKAKVTAREREDYLGQEIQRHGDDGRPYTAVETTRDDGTDAVVFAPCAQGRTRDASGW